MFKFFLKSLIILGIFLTLGSIYIRNLVINKVAERGFENSTKVVSRPIELSAGVSLTNLRFFSRLKRLGYRKVDSDPNSPGEFIQKGSTLLIFLKGGRFSASEIQEPQIYTFELSGSGTIQQIFDQRKKGITSVWLDPELLTLLGDSETRATTPHELKDYNKILVNTLITSEDERYYYHWGIDPLGIARAIYVNLSSGQLTQGGSTITQQLAKNLLLNSERSMMRKLIEVPASILLETAFSKEQILELYMNEIFLGQEGNVAIHGFGAAAESFFGKDVSDLTISESAILVGIIPAPSKFSPRNHPEEAKERRGIILQKLLDKKVISKTQFQQASAEPIKVRQGERTRKVARFFTENLRKEISEIVNTSKPQIQPLTLISTLDYEYQKCAEDAVVKGLENIEKTYPRLKRKQSPLQAALVSTEPTKGDVMAWVGGRDYSDNQYDHVAQMKRQPGSTFKPFVYLSALDSQLNDYKVATTTTLLMDEPVTINTPGSPPWKPENYDKHFRGEVTLREALTNSLNVPTIEIAQKIKIATVAKTAELFGFGKDLPRVPSLALGAGEISPYTLARAYGALANGGTLIDLRSLIMLRADLDGEEIFSPKQNENRVSSNSATYVLTNILQSAVNSGTGKIIRKLGFTRPVAGKTGTSNDTRDAWFAGYTPTLTTVIWVGFDDNKELRLTGGQAAAPIWTEYMKCVGEMEKDQDFTPPDDVVFKEIDYQTGLLYEPGCSEKVVEVFVRGTEPVDHCLDSPRRDLTEPVYNDEADELEPIYDPNSIHNQNSLPPARKPEGWGGLFR